MYESIPIVELKIKDEIKQSLKNLGYTETGNFIKNDDIILAKNLPKDQYIDLATAIAIIKASIIWEENNKT